MRFNISSITLIAVIIIGGGALLFLSDNGALSVPRTQSSAALSLDRPSHDFGTLDIYGGVVTTTFMLTNNGEEDVLIIEGSTTCGCTSGEIDGVNFGMHEQMQRDVAIPAGGTKELAVIFDPLAHGPSGVGLAERAVFLKTDSRVTPEVVVRFQALVVNNQ